MEQKIETLRLIHALTRALAHKIRTPLSVISNDLSYFQSQLEPGETERGLRKVREINEILKLCGELGSGEVKIESLNAEELKDLILQNAPEIAVNVSESKSYNLDKQKFILALQLIAHTLSDYCSKANLENCKITAVLDSKITLNVVRLEKDIKTESFTSLFCEQLQFDSPYPPIIDAILIAHDLKVNLIDGQFTILN
ncbi:MAG: hypothetical protein H6619_00315 [Deltaproteobacteria bacterium]|nr:hypothetical protein [Deltaproteobacteria bacterium]